MSETVIIVDFGGQYNQLIARRVRENNVYSEVVPYGRALEEIKAKRPKGIIFTGGPASVYEEGAPTVDREVFGLGIPVLGICYGAQLMAHLLSILRFCGSVYRGLLGFSENICRRKIPYSVNIQKVFLKILLFYTFASRLGVV